MIKSATPPFYPKDFIETADGLMFAVVAQGLEQDKVLCFLRYAREGNGWRKYATAEANTLLERYYPDYLYYSEVLDARLHSVSINRIVRHYQPRQRLQQILHSDRQDLVEQDMSRLCQLFQEHSINLDHAGITGSLLARTQQQSSDIDLICYNRQTFRQCRALVRQLIEQGQLQALDDDAWRQSFERRSCDLSFSDYVWHEQRKFNKALINGRKFDLNFIDSVADATPINYQKCGPIALRCLVIDDTHAFDYPAVFGIRHEQISTIVSFTATYTGQAFNGETIEVSGLLEQSDQGELRIVVGSTREANGEYIKVIY